MIKRVRFPVLLGAAIALTACATEGGGTGYNPYPQPPPVRTEEIPKPPVSEEPLIWQPGHWDWSGSGYIWRDGHWVKRGGHGTQWQDGYWTPQGGTWTWVPAHWL